MKSTKGTTDRSEVLDKQRLSVKTEKKGDATSRLAMKLHEVSRKIKELPMLKRHSLVNRILIRTDKSLDRKEEDVSSKRYAKNAVFTSKILNFKFMPKKAVKVQLSNGSLLQFSKWLLSR